MEQRDNLPADRRAFIDSQMSDFIDFALDTNSWSTRHRSMINRWDTNFLSAFSGAANLTSGGSTFTIGIVDLILAAYEKGVMDGMILAPGNNSEIEGINEPYKLQYDGASK